MELDEAWIGDDDEKWCECAASKQWREREWKVKMKMDARMESGSIKLKCCSSFSFRENSFRTHLNLFHFYSFHLVSPLLCSKPEKNCCFTVCMKIEKGEWMNGWKGDFLVKIVTQMATWKTFFQKLVDSLCFVNFSSFFIIFFIGGEVNVVCQLILEFFLQINNWS